MNQSAKRDVGAAIPKRSPETSRGSDPGVNTEPNLIPQMTTSSASARGALFDETCESREVFKHITGLWGALCLLSLRQGTLRFSELRRRACGVSEKLLAQTLQRLEEDGMVRRTAYPVIPPRVEYDLTELGAQAAEHLARLSHWVEIKMPAVRAARVARSGGAGRAG